MLWQSYVDPLLSHLCVPRMDVSLCCHFSEVSDEVSLPPRGAGCAKEAEALGRLVGAETIFEIDAHASREQQIPSHWVHIEHAKCTL